MLNRKHSFFIAVTLMAAPSIVLAQSIPPNKAFAPITSAIASTLSGAKAFQTTDYVASFYRNPASRGFDASLDTVVKILRAAGYVPEDAGFIPERGAPRLTYRIESRPSPGLTWSPLAASITLAGRTVPLEQMSTDHDMLPSNSWSTPAGGIDAEIVNVGGGTDAELDKIDLKGKIAYFQPGGGGRGGRGSTAAGPVTRAAAHGAVGVLLSQTLPKFNQQEKNRRAIGFSSITYDPSAKIFALYVSLAARDTIDAALAKGPVRAHVVTSTVFEGRSERKVVAEIRGAIAPEERFVFSAHVQEPGANDNATGVGLLAEMARTAAVLLKTGKINPGRTITMLWGVEIQQTREFIAEDSLRRKGIKWGMSLDMVGENTARTGGTFLIEKMPDPSKIWVRGEDQHTEWGEGSRMTQKDIWPHYYNDFIKQRCVDESRRTGGSWVVKANPYEGGSDHTPFVAARIPGVLMWHFTDQHYHDDLDRIDMVSADELQHVGNCALASALILTSGNHPEYARAAIDEMTGIAERRLDAEGELSRGALAKSSVDSQRVILEAWRDYYVGAIAAIPEMTLPPLRLSPEVAAAQERVRRKAGQVLATLH
jgi:aminopeptidase YwaD